ncbi:hypothetical protein K501DRAFT_240775 [Backusella circina FSU 941]|nr:hypothetical protein K501DRAFT_240775 [Backusella circina FSU 941]
MTSTPILSITNTSQLAEYCAVIVPCIWTGSFKSHQQPLLNPKRHTAFKLFVQKILKATQISCTCIILALYYIQQLRTAYPSIRASIGSEVRLFTTALVLANKYLDDNTFTNKTWSEVSSIPVTELNIMEMEFLSALNYSIHIPHHKFFQWTLQCQQWWTPFTQQQQQQPTNFSFEPTTTTSTPLKRSHEDDIVPPSKKRSSFEFPPTPPNSWAAHPSICKPILSWSSSVSALASSRHAMHAAMPIYSNPYSAASVATAAAVAAVNANYSTNLLASRVRCLEIE